MCKLIQHSLCLRDVSCLRAESHLDSPAHQFHLYTYQGLRCSKLTLEASLAESHLVI